MSRLFAFGCSFTQYWRWPTWADALGQDTDAFENWGICGGGNAQILYNLMECHQRNRLTPEDEIVIMWTSTSREDRYVKDRWLEGGNIYWSAGSRLPRDYVRQFACERGYTIRDMAMIAATRQVLESIGCQWRFFSMVPLSRSNSQNSLGESPSGSVDLRDVHDLYRNVLDSIAPSVLEIVFNGNWYSGQGIADASDASRRDFHPTPEEHMRYLDQVWPERPLSAHARRWMYTWQENVIAGDTSWASQHARPKLRL